MFFQEIDETISGWMLKLHGNDFINQTMKFFSLIGEAGIIWILILVLLLIVVVSRKKKCPVVLLFAGLFLLIGWLFNDYCLKLLIHRSRPYLNHEAFGTAFEDFMVSIHYSFPKGYSFPSGHSFSSFNAATGLALYKKKLGFLTYPIAFLIAFSRIFLGAHYFTDVLIGSLIGVAFGFLSHFLGKKLFQSEKIRNHPKFTE